MQAVLGIDAAWTEREPTGVALVRQTVAGDWACVAVAPSYDAFCGLAHGLPVNWSARPAGGLPDPGTLLGAARKLLAGTPIRLVSVDMPLATNPITERRRADDEVSRRFGGQGCSAHSPRPDRPGAIGEALRDAFATEGFPLATARTQPGTPNHLIEVYPHPALLTLLSETYRVRYKVSRSGRYWPGKSAEARVGLLLDNFAHIERALRSAIQGIDVPWPPARGMTLAGLKRYEDALDALVCAWVGIRYLNEASEPLGDETAAIWVPRPA